MEADHGATSTDEDAMAAATMLESLTTDISKARPFGSTDIARKYASRKLRRECDGVSYEGGKIAPFWEFNGIRHYCALAV